MAYKILSEEYAQRLGVEVGDEVDKLEGLERGKQEEQALIAAGWIEESKEKGGKK